MIFTHWMCNCSLQLLSINMHNDLLISPPTSLLFSLCVDWVHGGHGDDAEIQEASVWKGWVNAISSHSTLVLGLSGWCVGNDCVSQSHVDPPVLQGNRILLWHTKGWRQSRLASVAELFLTVSGISHLPPCGHFCYWITPWGICGKLIEKIWTMLACSGTLTCVFSLSFFSAHALHHVGTSVSIFTSDT